MLRGSLSALIFFFLLSTAIAGALESAPITTTTPWPHETSNLLPDPALDFGRLENGMRYILMNNSEPRDRVSMHLVVAAGSFHESDGQQGLAHFLEHMVFNGSRHFPPGELVKYFQRIGMQFGPDANAGTGFFNTVYDILLPDGKTESLADGLLVLRDYADGALLSESEIERERKVILAEKRSRDSAAYRTFVDTLGFEMVGSRIPLRFPIGTETVIKSAVRSDFLDFYNSWYRPDNITLLLIGDFDIQTARALIHEKFADFQTAAPLRPVPSFGTIRHNGFRGYYHHEKEAGSTSVSIETLTEAPPEHDSAEFQKKMLKQRLANAIVQHRLDTRVRKPKSPITEAYIGSGKYFRYADYAEISAQCAPEDWKAAIALVEQTLRGALEYGFSKEELHRVKQEIRSDLETSVRKAATRDSSHLARGVIRHLNADRVFMSPQQELDFFMPVVQRVTPDEIHAAFRDTWAASHRLVLVTGNVDLGSGNEKAEQRILRAYRNSLDVPVVSPVMGGNITFPYLPEPEGLGAIIHKTYLSDLDVWQVDFQNGLRLNLKQTDFKKDEVSAVLSFGGGSLLEPPGKAGLSYLAVQVLNESGLGRMTKDELEKSLAGRNTNVHLVREEDRFQFQGRTVAAEIRLLFQLFRSYLLDPTLRPEAFDLVRQRYAQKYRSMSTSVEAGMMLQGRRFLAGGDTRFGLPSLDEFSGLSLANAADFLLEWLETGSLELSVVGDFDPEEVIPMVGAYLGTITGRHRSPPEEPVTGPTFPEGGYLEISVPTRIPKGQICIVYPTDDIWDIGQTRRLMVLASILDDRLRETVREKLGAAYSPVSYNAPSRAYQGYGFLQVSIILDPAEMTKIIDAVKEITEDLATQGVTQEELERALAPTLTGLKELRRENFYWRDTVLDGSREHPQQIEWSRTIVDDYASIRADDLNQLARRFLQSGKAAVIVITPENDTRRPGKIDP